jgi:hypothetical protein
MVGLLDEELVDAGRRAYSHLGVGAGGSRYR